MLSCEAARTRILAAARSLGTERTPLDRALNRTLAADVRAAIDLPRFDQSAVDGYALADPVRTILRLTGSAEAGRPFTGRTSSSTAVRILTGARVPPGVTAVVMQERVTKRGEIIRLSAPVPPGANIRRRGEDVRKGEVVLSGGATIGAREIGLLSALGVPAVTVFRRPTVAILATGTELTRPGKRLTDGGLYDANGPMVRALVTESGAVPRDLGTVHDDLTALTQAVRKGLEADVLILCGGVSVGDKDLVRPAAKRAGVREVFWRVNIKPGMPLFFGRKGTTLVFGLPGNPVSVYLTFREFVKPALDRLGGRAWTDAFTDRATLAEPLCPSRARRTHFVRVVRDPSPTANELLVRPVTGQGSHQLLSLVRAHGWVRVESSDAGLAKGSRVPARMEPGPC